MTDLNPACDRPSDETGTPEMAIQARSPSSFGTVGALAVLSASLSACGGGGGGTASSASTTPTATPSLSDSEAARFLLQAQFSATDTDIADVKSQGLTNWLTRQYTAASSGTLWDWLETRGYNTVTTDKYYSNNRLAECGLWDQLINSPDQLRRRVALALSEHFVAPINVANRWPSAIAAGYWDVLNTHAFGNFRDLLEAVTLNLQMGLFLNMSGSRKPDTSGRQPDENYAREVMQLFTLGLNQLNADGTPKTDALTGNTVDTYTQSDVTNLAHVFTGYAADVSNITEYTVSWETSPVRDPAYARRPMSVTSSLHSTEAVSFLGVSLAEGTAASASMKTALDTLFNHANVGPFFAKAMIKRLVSSNPSAAYVKRVADAFANNGAGVRGDLRAVWTAILTDSEARATPTSTGGKLREPIIRFIQWARMAEVTSTNGLWAIGDLSSMQYLGQSPLRAASVFNFFRPGYIPPNTDIAARNLEAPEFQIVNESTTAGYLNFMQVAVRSGVMDVKPQYTTLLTKVADPASLMSALNLRLTANQLSAASLSTIQTAITTLPATTDAEKLIRIQAAVFLALASPEYLIQK